MRVLTVNAGSTSLKLERYDLTVPLPDLADPPAPVATYATLDDALRDPFDAAAHRFVRVPDAWHAVTRVDEAALHAVGGVASDAPLHDASAMRAVETIARSASGVPQYAVSDSAFHGTLTAEAATYAIPRAWTRAGLRRRGFHGLSHEYAAHRGARLAGLDVARARVVTLHLGGGSSLCAIRGGASVDTTMGYTPLDGIPMATRSGSVDPGLLVHVLREGITLDALEETLERGSGLLGISGRSGDVRDLLAAADDPDARLALDVLAWRTRAAFGAMVAALGGVDLAVFTGGVGEHAAPVRDAILAGTHGWAGSFAVQVVPARENWMLARAVVLSSSASS